MTTRWVVSRVVIPSYGGLWRAYPPLWHLRDDPPHRTGYLMGWSARNGSDDSTFARMSRRTDEEIRHPVSVCPACLFSTGLPEGMARCGR